MSEFAQEAPLWSRQPYKIFYFIYFGLSVGFIFLPWFAIVSIFPSKRERPSWTWKKSTLVKLYRHGTRLTFRTHTSLSRDLTKEVPHSKTVRAKFVWVEGLSEDFVRGELKRMLEIQGLSTVRTCGFWYGERDGGGGVGQKASPNEKVIYHLHGGAYWIGTAHEDDVTSAVNKELQTTNAGSGGVCKRAFSLDYRLCVPGRPEVGSFPAPLADAVAGYRYLVNECNFEPKNIIVAGDSAGGNLALALCRYLRDEKLDGLKVPGAMLLLSPWADTSRSHSGPIARPNKLDTVWRNRKSDIIANSAAFRNTAVSALLGKMAARETYRNPYLSSISLQLDAKNGGAGPSYGFEGFPKRTYICTGTAEISHDQHLTLAYRMAAGTALRVPMHEGDKCSEDADPYEMAARLQYPRPENHEVTIWPSAQNTPITTPISDDSREDRSVVLDECIDGIHDYTLFDWFEPERSQTWGRIARWIDEDI
ncbi:alpha/beta-hydrolase [Meira miltonrushii]|uniref:Alpha/beta-hydrolase n=1 Tax=Meira miltonrushii TaxID=1280837 RepID=A0A316VL86_9BASI|nr:alpha/beta-hydrolase [Meira miltonrushii]PWN38316.1 alpha/beta-hydrolase [Meira miltonrushii]